MHRYWTLNEAEARAWQVPPQALPSDARERADLVALASGNLKAAQVLPRLDGLQPLQLYTKIKGNTLLLCFLVLHSLRILRCRGVRIHPRLRAHNLQSQDRCTHE